MKHVENMRGDPGFTAVPLGIYWLQDMNEDGDAKDSGETQLYHPMYAGAFLQVLAAKKP